jgi:hypothetical protein
VFSKEEAAISAIDKIRNIHSAVEKARGDKIPDWAYRDVLFMLIHYSIASFEVLERKLSEEEKEDAFEIFYRVGSRMEIPGLPRSYQEWLIMRKDHLEKNLEKTKYTIDLYKQYRKHLGPIRYKLLLEGQKLVVPEKVKSLLGFNNTFLLTPVLVAYKLCRKLKMDWFMKSLILPSEYKKQIKDLDLTPSW